MPPMAPITGLEIFYVKIRLCFTPDFVLPGSPGSGGGGWSRGGGGRGWFVRNERSYDGNSVESIEDGRGLCGGDAEDVEDLVPHDVPDHTDEEIQDELGRKSVLFLQAPGLFLSLASLAAQNQHRH